jgi:hypothetical protein
MNMKRQGIIALAVVAVIGCSGAAYAWQQNQTAQISDVQSDLNLAQSTIALCDQGIQKMMELNKALAENDSAETLTMVSDELGHWADKRPDLKTSDQAFDAIQAAWKDINATRKAAVKRAEEAQKKLAALQ